MPIAGDLLRRVLVAWLLGAGVLAPAGRAQEAPPAERVGFIGVALDAEARLADRKLQGILHQGAGVDFAPEEMEYERVIDRLTRNPDGSPPFLARVTPYVYVVAEKLGARLELLGTYAGRTTGKNTYRSYFVVRKEAFPEKPTFEEVMRRLATGRDRPRFIFHNEFSTSGHFLPALHFRAHRLFHMPAPTETLRALSSERVSGGGSAGLVRAVALGEADLCAVWEGTRVQFDRERDRELFERYGRKVHFVELPMALPNDLLVCSSSLDPALRERVRRTLGTLGPRAIDVGDVLTWLTMADAADARQALAELSWQARDTVAPVTLDIRRKGGPKPGDPPLDLREAARNAVRLSGTEFVLYDEDFHERVDVAWTLEAVHDGAILLRSSLPGTGIPDQIFQVSHGDPEDLVRRLVSILRTRMHRIRSVWSHSGPKPRVMRDTEFALPPGAPVKVQKIRWLDPDRNKFLAGTLVDARILSSGPHTCDLDPRDFAPLGDPAVTFDPMSNVSYRVFLLRPSEEKPVFRVLTGALLLLLLLGAAAGIRELARR